MSRNPRTPLSPTAEDALEILVEPINDREDDGFPQEEAHQLLVDHEAFDQSRAERAIHQLLMRGYLYKVDEYLFVTTE